MTRDKVSAFVIGEVASLLGAPAAEVSEQMALFGDTGEVDSRILVELMLACEEHLETEYDAPFDWYSDAALSGSRSRLRTVGTLIDLVTEKASEGVHA